MSVSERPGPTDGSAGFDPDGAAATPGVGAATTPGVGGDASPVGGGARDGGRGEVAPGDGDDLAGVRGVGVLVSTYSVPGMDCAAEEQLVRLALATEPGVLDVDVDLSRRVVDVRHRGEADRVTGRMSALGMRAALTGSVPDESTEPEPEPDAAGSDAAARTGGAAEVPNGSRGRHRRPRGTRDRPDHGPAALAQRRVLLLLLGLNAAMALIEGVVGLFASSAGVLADGLDMAADATVYGLALYAVGRPPRFALRAARSAGVVQFVLAAALLVDVLRRAVTGGVDPLPGPMVVVTLLALAVNIESTRLTARHRGDGVHLRAAWIFSAADVLGNVGVLLAAALVAVTGQVWPDLAVGTAVALGVAAGAWSILRLR